MIHYQLRCADGHGFDGWFVDSAGFERQAKAGLIACPRCGDLKIERALMAPAVPRKGAPARNRRQPDGAADGPAAAPARSPAPRPGQGMGQGTAQAVASIPEMSAEIRAVLQKLRAEVESRCDYVGPEFAAEARRIKSGEREDRGIYGETTPEEAEALADEGIEVSRIPWVPRADS
ncbi:MAG: DUF1178 family protein [Rhodospirillales bacterium]|nr:DUF1178 family protein [Rhodospirillales bacterium]